MRAQHLGGGLAVPGQPAGEAPVEQQPERVDVAGGHRVVADEPLRGEVGGGAEDRPVGVEAAAGVIGEADDAEVDELRRAGGEHDVGRFDVAVHNRSACAAASPAATSAQIRIAAVGRSGPAVSRSASVGPSNSSMTTNGLPSGGFAVVEDVRDVWVRKACRGPGLDADPAAPVGVGGERAGEDLDRDEPVEDLVPGPPHH